jgi:hypothetical protein
MMVAQGQESMVAKDVRTAIRSQLYRAKRFIDEVAGLEAQFGRTDSRLIAELELIQSICDSVREPVNAPARRLAVVEADLENWADRALLSQCEDFRYGRPAEADKGINDIDLWTEFAVGAGPDAPGLVDRMLEAIRSGGRAAGATVMMMEQLYAIDRLDGLVLRSPGSTEPVGEKTFIVALWLRECAAMGGCGPDALPTRLFCRNVAACAQNVSIDQAVRSGLPMRDQQDIALILNWLGPPRG